MGLIKKINLGNLLQLYNFDDLISSVSYHLSTATFFVTPSKEVLFDDNRLYIFTY